MKIDKIDSQSKIPTLPVPGVSVDVRDGNINKALRIFNKKVQDEGIIREVREREFFEKPSVVKKRKKEIARKRWLKKQEAANPIQKRLY